MVEIQAMLEGGSRGGGRRPQAEGYEPQQAQELEMEHPDVRWQQH